MKYTRFGVYEIEVYDIWCVWNLSIRNWFYRNWSVYGIESVRDVPPPTPSPPSILIYLDHLKSEVSFGTDTVTVTVTVTSKYTYIIRPLKSQNFLLVLKPSPLLSPPTILICSGHLKSGGAFVVDTVTVTVTVTVTFKYISINKPLIFRRCYHRYRYLEVPLSIQTTKPACFLMQWVKNLLYNCCHRFRYLCYRYHYCRHCHLKPFSQAATSQEYQIVWLSSEHCMWQDSCPIKAQPVAPNQPLIIVAYNSFVIFSYSKFRDIKNKNNLWQQCQVQYQFRI